MSLAQQLHQIHILVDPNAELLFEERSGQEIIGTGLEQTRREQTGAVARAPVDILPALKDGDSVLSRRR
ncbi:MAG: hypothetical protein ACLFMS_08575, partial [Halorhodospira sp.]